MIRDGALVIDKAVGPTSHDVVARVRRLIGQRRVGHTGTLDPGASGVLVVLFGRATRLARFLQAGTKTYVGMFVLGVTTDSLDADGKETSRRRCAAGRREVQEAAAALVGAITQVPPMISAVKVDGAKLYERARRGESVQREPRRVSVGRFDITGFEAGEFPRVSFEVECGKGTYVRSLVASVGESLDCGAHLASLRRTVNGSYSLDEAFTLENLEANPDTLDQAAIPIDEIRTGLPRLEPDDAALRKVGFGTPLTEADCPRLADLPCDSCVEMRSPGRLVAVYLLQRGAQGMRARAECVLVPAQKESPS